MKYKTRSLNSSLITLLLVTGLFVGGFITRMEYDKKINVLDNELSQVKEELVTTQENYQSEVEKSEELSRFLTNACAELEAANETLDVLKSGEYELRYFGGFNITYYCDERHGHICGGSGLTASGKPTEIGWTIATDWSVLPRGTVVYINGIGFREVQDVGGAVNGNHIDVLVETHSEALTCGSSYEDVWVLVKKNS